MKRECLYAFTEVHTHAYPGYVNLSDENGEAVLTLRTSDGTGSQSATLALDASVALKLADAIYARYAKQATLELPPLVK